MAIARRVAASRRNRVRKRDVVKRRAAGDGVRCTGGSLVRIGQKLAVAGVASYPEAGDLPISQKGLVGPLGGPRTYQVAYRNVASYCTAATINFTNGAVVFWRP